MTHLLNFKARFADDVESGKKRQTLRPPRKRLIRPGDTLRLYTGLRQKGARLLREATCKSVNQIIIDAFGACSRFWHLKRRSTALANADGFKDWAELWKFFDAQYPSGSSNRTPDGNGIILDLIKW